MYQFPFQDKVFLFLIHLLDSKHGPDHWLDMAQTQTGHTSVFCGGHHAMSSTMFSGASVPGHEIKSQFLSWIILVALCYWEWIHLKWRSKEKWDLITHDASSFVIFMVHFKYVGLVDLVIDLQTHTKFYYFRYIYVVIMCHWSNLRDPSICFTSTYRWK